MHINDIIIVLVVFPFFLSFFLFFTSWMTTYRRRRWNFDFRFRYTTIARPRPRVRDDSAAYVPKRSVHVCESLCETAHTHFGWINGRIATSARCIYKQKKQICKYRWRFRRIQLKWCVVNASIYKYILYNYLKTIIIIFFRFPFFAWQLIFDL